MASSLPSVVTMSSKVCLLGDFAVGKTSLVRRFVYDLFDDKYISTIGVKVSRKTVAVPQADQVVELSLILWDLAGGEKFDPIQATYMRGAAGAVLVCDVTRAETLDRLNSYVSDLQQVSPAAVFVLAANKSDLEPWEVSKEQVEAFAASIGATCFFTSAKTGDQVEALFRELGRQLVEKMNGEKTNGSAS